MKRSEKNIDKLIRKTLLGKTYTLNGKRERITEEEIRKVIEHVRKGY